MTRKRCGDLVYPGTADAHLNIIVKASKVLQYDYFFVLASIVIVYVYSNLKVSSDYLTCRAS